MKSQINICQATMRALKDHLLEIELRLEICCHNQIIKFCCSNPAAILGYGAVLFLLNKMEGTFPLYVIHSLSVSCNSRISFSKHICLILPARLSYVMASKVALCVLGNLGTNKVRPCALVASNCSQSSPQKTQMLNMFLFYSFFKSSRFTQLYSQATLGIQG